jgi:predicted N-acetyltransferase YhbS
VQPVEARATGLEALDLATQLLQRARLADRDAGLWEAADLQWWWRAPRRSDSLEQVFWRDDDGPVAAIVLTDWGQTWGCDILRVRGDTELALSHLVDRAVQRIEAESLDSVEMLVRDDDRDLVGLVQGAGFMPTLHRSGVTWMDSTDRPGAVSLPAGFSLVNRAGQRGRHPMQRRNGDRVEERLRECSLYDPALDLALVANATVAGYALFWFDRVTKVGLVEPMRIEDAFQRRGLGRALLTAGLDRLAERGAQRLKVGYSTEAALRLYRGVGFVTASTATSYRRGRGAAAAAIQSGRWRSDGPT